MAARAVKKPARSPEKRCCRFFFDSNQIHLFSYILPVCFALMKAQDEWLGPSEISIAWIGFDQTLNVQ
jgi:hypothetical protein